MKIIVILTMGVFLLMMQTYMYIYIYDKLLLELDIWNRTYVLIVK